MEEYLYKFTNVSIEHKLDHVDILILPIHNNASEVWSFNQGNVIECLHV